MDDPISLTLAQYEIDLPNLITLVGDQPGNYINLPKRCATIAGITLDLVFTHDLLYLTKPCASISKPIKSTFCRHT